MVAEVAGDRLAVTHEDMAIGMTIDRDKTRGFMANPGTKDPLEEDEDDLTKAQMYLAPELLEEPPAKMINGVSIAKKLDTLWTNVTRKCVIDKRPQKRPNYEYYQTPTMGKTPHQYLIQKPTLCMTTQTMTTLTS